ncbi:MAG: hypothetical protein Fur005_16210 [Roseiflexaceae bacterium]
MIVVHATAGTLRSALAWLTNPVARVSAHYVIGKQGQVYQLVLDELCAWHAGRASWQGYSEINECSLGIELENANNGRDPYPEAQVAALITLMRGLIKTYTIEPIMVTRHSDVAEPRGRKTDPAGFPWQELMRQLFPDATVVPERPTRPDQGNPQQRQLAELLTSEAFRVVGAYSQQLHGLARTAATLELGMPLRRSFECRIGRRWYLAQAFGRDTLICPIGEWDRAERLSELSSRDPVQAQAVIEQLYLHAGEPFREDWAIHQAARTLPVGAPLAASQRVRVGSREFVAICYALDILYSPVGQWQSIGRLSTLSEKQADLRAALLELWFRRVGSFVRPRWSLFEAAQQQRLGAPLSPSFRINCQGQEFVGESYALDVVACPIGAWNDVQRLSVLRAQTEEVLAPITP